MNWNGGHHAYAPHLDSPDGCTAGDNNRKEYTSFAASEGIATYYAAVAFNSTTDPNCEVALDDDYNHQNDGAVAGDNELTPSCEGDPSETWANENYLYNECLGSREDRGTKIDWWRLFWDLDHTWSLTTDQIFGLWGAADPHTWDGDGGGGADDPEERFGVAADGNHQNVLYQWTQAAADNGVY